ncbi:hypothetical protein ACFP3I_14390 [Chryseobacterium arachidis]
MIIQPRNFGFGAFVYLMIAIASSLRSSQSLNILIEISMLI